MDADGHWKQCKVRGSNEDTRTVRRIHVSKRFPGFHAITGCDYNPALFREGKLRPYKLLKKLEESQKAFIKFSESVLTEDSDERKNVFYSIQKYIYTVYNARNVFDVDSARVEMFIDSYKVSDIKELSIEKN